MPKNSLSKLFLSSNNIWQITIRNINRSVEAYEFRTIGPNNGQLRNILDIAGGGGGGGSVDLSKYYTKAQADNIFTPYYDKGEIYILFTSYYDKTETDNLFTPYYTKTETDNFLELHIVQKETETNNLSTCFLQKLKLNEIDTSLNNQLNVSTPEMTDVLKSNEIDSK